MSFPRYPNYKDSGVEWLGEVPQHWEVKRLRFVAELNPSKSEVGSLDRETSVSFLPMEAIGDDGSLSLNSERTISEVESGYTYFRNGDVTIAKITPCFENGKGALMQDLVNGIGFGTTELIVARPKPDEIIGTYLHYLFISPDFRRLGESYMFGAGGQKRIPDTFVRNFATALPPLDEQVRITAFLDREIAKIDTLVKEQRRLVDLMSEKRRAVISHAVSKGLNPNAGMKPSRVQWFDDIPSHWISLQLGKVCSNVADGPHFSPVYEDHGVPFLSARNIRMDGWALDDVKYISARDCAEFDRRIVPQIGDVLYTKGGTTGIARAVDLDYRFQVWVHVAVLKIIPDLVDPEFLAFMLNSDCCYEQSQLLTRGATNNDLGLTRMIKIWIALPPIIEQRAIADFLDGETRRIDALNAQAQLATDLLLERRAALVSAAVTGKIDVRAVADLEAA